MNCFVSIPESAPLFGHKPKPSQTIDMHVTIHKKSFIASINLICCATFDCGVLALASSFCCWSVLMPSDICLICCFFRPLSIITYIDFTWEISIALIQICVTNNTCTPSFATILPDILVVTGIITFIIILGDPLSKPIQSKQIIFLPT